MGKIRQLFEDALKAKIVPLDNKYNGIPISKDGQDLTHKQIVSGESGSIVDVEAINKFRTLSSDRQERYSQFESLLKDATIAAAIEMYADDATQYDYKTGKIIWAESEDENVAKAANRLIDVLNLNQKAWQHIYALAAYGDVYLRLYRKGDKSDYAELYGDDHSGATAVRIKTEDATRPLEEYIEYVSDPATMYDLQERDKTCGFIRMVNQDVEESSSTYTSLVTKTLDVSDVNIYDRKCFVHICLEGNIDRNPEIIALKNGDSTSVYRVKTGKSILADAYDASQTVKLLEDSMMLSRITKSALVRIIQVEVGNMPKPESEALLRRYKNMIEQKLALNKQNGVVSSYNSPGPMENIVYTMTHEGKGVITSQNLGGDVNIKDIVDLDYFNNKKLSALKIPKQYLNYDAPEGLGNGTSLTKLSSRYAHSIMRLQNAYMTGITTLINLFFLDQFSKDVDIKMGKERINGNNYINNFTLKMVTPATIEDTERDEQLDMRLNQAQSILSMIEGKTDDQGIFEVMQWILSEFMHLSDITDILQNHPVMHDEEPEFDTPDNDFGGGGAFHSSGRSSSPSFDTGSEPDIGGETPDLGGGLEEPTGGTETTMTPEA